MLTHDGMQQSCRCIIDHLTDLVNLLFILIFPEFPRVIPCLNEYLLACKHIHYAQ